MDATQPILEPDRLYSLTAASEVKGGKPDVA